jgi:hypothetical protein
LHRRMANCAAGARSRPGDSEAFRYSLRPRVQQDRKCLGVKILPAPGGVLAALGTGPTVAAGRFAADRSHKHPAALANLPRLFRGEATDGRCDKETDADDSQQHTKSLAPVFCRMRLQSSW